VKYNICQTVKIVDMNDEIIAEVLFEHGQFEIPSLVIGSSVLSYQLGLKEFEVVFDKREGKHQRYKIVDVEIDLIQKPATLKAFLEPVTLIVGQHDIGLM